MRYVLLVDDDPISHHIVKAALDSETQLISCFSLKDTDSILESDKSISLLIIDRMLPDGDGLSLCSKLRGIDRFKELPIIFISSKISETDKVSGLFAGADDYLCKPVSPLELKARIAARLRTTTKNLTLGNLTIDPTTYRTSIHINNTQTEVELTRIEFKLLLTLMQSPDRIFSRDQLINLAWGPSAHLSDRAVDTHISHLRKKITGAGLAIEALRGEGYKIVALKKSNLQAA